MRKSIFGVVISLSFLTSCDLEKPVQTQSEKPRACSLKAAQQNQTGIRRIAPADLKVGSDYSIPVISNAQKFIIPVPAFVQGGEPLVYPQSYEKAGQPILDYTGKPVGDRGLVFFNGKDKSWQAVKGDGEGVIITNEVTQEQAKQLYQKVQELKPDPNNLTLDELKQVLSFAQQQLGLIDMYNSSRAFVQEKMTPVIAGEVPKVNGNEVKAYGFVKRDDRDVNQAIYIPGEFVFEGPAASPQEFKDGGVIVEQGGKMRGVQPDIFVRTYKLSDGRSISSVTADLKTQCD
ncbi:MAG TPA: hypothetical protein VFW91_10180 [Candidatus Binatia bacterium]|nr:hypothetical protein [Candidatus Binatia bacterium]